MSVIPRFPSCGEVRRRWARGRCAVGGETSIRADSHTSAEGCGGDGRVGAAERCHVVVLEMPGIRRRWRPVVFDGAGDTRSGTMPAIWAAPKWLSVLTGLRAGVGAGPTSSSLTAIQRHGDAFACGQEDVHFTLGRVVCEASVTHTDTTRRRGVPRCACPRCAERRALWFRCRRRKNRRTLCTISATWTLISIGICRSARIRVCTPPQSQLTRLRAIPLGTSVYERQTGDIERATASGHNTMDEVVASQVVRFRSVKAA